MRAGLIVAGVLLLVIGFGLSLTIIGALIGIPIGFIGFVMILVGLFTSGTKIVPVAQQQQQVVVVPSQPYVETPKKLERRLSSLEIAILREISQGKSIDDLSKITGVDAAIISEKIGNLYVEGYLTRDRLLTEKGFEALKSSQ